MAEEESPSQSPEKFCVLIIEEKSDLRAFYLGILAKNGNYSVKNTATVNEALEILATEAENINVIFFDWNMSEMDGPIFSQKIRANSRYDHIEFVVCSTSLTQEDSFLMVELDVHYTFTKGATATEFLSSFDAIRAHYQKVENSVSKLKQLQHFLNDADEKQCEKLFQIPEVLYEINNNPRFVHMGGEAHILKRKYDEAVELLKGFLSGKASKAPAENLKSLSTLGKALCFLDRFDEALSIFERLEAKSPKNLSHKVMMGDALLGMEKVSEAEEKYNEVLDSDPEHKGALVGLVKSSAVKGEFEESKSFFEKIEGPFESRTLASFFNNKGVSLVRKGQVTEAIQFYENALQFLTKYKGHVYFNLGMAYYRVGNIASAVNCFQAALASQEAKSLSEKTILKELNKKGVDKFISDFNAHRKKTA